MIVKKVESQEELRQYVKYLKEGADPAGKHVLADCDMLFWRGVAAWVVMVDDKPVSINMTHFGKTRRNCYEPYANWYVSATRFNERCLGYASSLAKEVQRMAVEAGCIRVKALVGTKYGYYLCRSIGVQLWAVTDKREIMVDSPLVSSEDLNARGWIAFPTDVPPVNAKKWTDRIHPFTREELDEIIKTPLRYE